MNMIWMFTELQLILHITTFIMVSFISFSFLIFFRHTQINNQISNFRNEQITATLLEQFLCEHTKLFLIIDHAVRENSKIFMTFLIGFMPHNILLTVKQLLSVDRGLQSNIITLLIVGELFGLFGIHLICTKYMKYIHTTGLNQLMRIDAQLNIHSRRTHYKVSFHIEKFHTKNRYGYMYGRFGVITLVGFVKVSRRKISKAIFKEFYSSLLPFIQNV